MEETVDAGLGWQRRLDQVCDRYEDAWRDGFGPRIEDYLRDADVPPSRRAAMLVELLKVDRELRQARGDPPTISEYLDRFPGYAPVVRSLFGDQRVGNYDLIGPVGEGGMGVVYRAHHRAMNRVVALKMIRPFHLDDSTAVDRFRLEAQIAARLEHEHIVPVFEAGQADGQHFFTMRYIAGRSLAEVIDRRPIDGRRAARYLEQVARAVDYAHTRDVLHRDLKPRNILIDAEDRAFVTDFGMAKVLGGSRGATLTGDRLGTPPYMSPEQVRDPSRAGIASDVYSLGATLYEALTGCPPFQGDDPIEIMEKIGRQEPTPPRTINPDCARDLETICLKCLEKEPSRRYTSALELADDLRRFLDGVPIQARRVGPFERARKWARRHPAPAALAVVSLIAILALAGVAVLQRALADSEQGYHQARVVVDQVAEFGQRRLRDQPKLLKELLEILLREHGDFLARHRNDPKFAREAADTLTRMARLMDLIGSRQAALRAHEQALQLRLTMAVPTSERRAELAESYHEIGDLQRALGHPDESIVSYRQALAIRRQLVAARPGDRALLSDLARSYGYIGDWELTNGWRRDARASYLEAERIRERLVAQDGSDLVARFQLARSYNNSGYLEREVGHLDEASRQHEKAVVLQQELVAVDPKVARRRLEADDRNYDITDSDFQFDLAASHNALGTIRDEQGRPDAAVEEFRRAKRLLDALVLDHPGVTRFEGELAWTLTELGLLRGSTEDLDRARGILEALVGGNPGVTRFKAELARNQAALGELARRSGQFEKSRNLLDAALSTQQEIVADNPDDFDYRHELLWTRQVRKRLPP